MSAVFVVILPILLICVPIPLQLGVMVSKKRGNVRMVSATDSGADIFWSEVTVILRQIRSALIGVRISCDRLNKNSNLTREAAGRWSSVDRHRVRLAEPAEQNRAER